MNGEIKITLNDETFRAAVQRYFDQVVFTGSVRVEVTKLTVMQTRELYQDYVTTAGVVCQAAERPGVPVFGTLEETLDAADTTEPKP